MIRRRNNNQDSYRLIPVVDIVALISIVFLMGFLFYGGKYSELKHLEPYKDELRRIEEMKQKIEEQEKEIAYLKQRLKELERDFAIYTIPENKLRFSTLQYNLTEEHKKILRSEIVNIKKMIKEGGSDFNTLLIIGCTDIEQIREEYRHRVKNNYELGIKRAFSIADFIIETEDWYRSEFKNIKIVPSSFGQHLPTGRGFDNDRRVIFMVMKMDHEKLIR